MCLDMAAGTRAGTWYRFAQGETALPAIEALTSHAGSALEERVARLEQEVAELRAALAAITGNTTG